MTVARHATMADERVVTIDEVRAKPSRTSTRASRAACPLPPIPPDPSRHPRSTDTFERSSPSQSYRVRVLDSEKFSKTQQLAEGARDFCDKVSQLNDIVKTVVEAVDQQARLPRLPRHVIFSRVDRRGSAHPASPPPRSLESSLNPRTRASVPLRRRRREQRAKSCARSVSAIRWRRRLRRGGETPRRLPSGEGNVAPSSTGSSPSTSLCSRSRRSRMRSSRSCQGVALDASVA